MAYSITQARPLLTAAELELFDQSRAAPIKALTLARLRGKVSRARTLRDKYRDLYRRQTVSARKSSAAKSRLPVGADNERTQRKADILQEVLTRFEARVAQLEAQQDREAGATAKRKGTAASKSSRPAVAPRKQAAPAKSPRTAAAKKSRAAEPARDSMKADKKNTPGKTQAASPQRPAVAVPAPAKSSPAGGVVRLAAPVHPPIQEAVLNQHATRSIKAPSDLAPTANGKAHAPLPHAPIGLVPAALRGNVLKQAPGQIAIHAHQGASMRRAQGKRDSR